MIPTLATKVDLVQGLGDLRTDLHKGLADVIKWIFGTALACAAAAITIMMFVLNNAAPKTLPPASGQTQATVVVLPLPQLAAPKASR